MLRRYSGSWKLQHDMDDIVGMIHLYRLSLFVLWKGISYSGRRKKAPIYARVIFKLLESKFPENATPAGSAV